MRGTEQHTLEQKREISMVTKVKMISTTLHGQTTHHFQFLVSTSYNKKQIIKVQSSTRSVQSSEFRDVDPSIRSSLYFQFSSDLILCFIRTLQETFENYISTWIHLCPLGRANTQFFIYFFPPLRSTPKQKDIDT